MSSPSALEWRLNQLQNIPREVSCEISVVELIHLHKSLEGGHLYYKPVINNFGTQVAGNVGRLGEYSKFLACFRLALDCPSD